MTEQQARQEIADKATRRKNAGLIAAAWIAELKRDPEEFEIEGNESFWRWLLPEKYEPLLKKSTYENFTKSPGVLPFWVVELARVVYVNLRGFGIELRETICTDYCKALQPELFADFEYTEVALEALGLSE